MVFAISMNLKNMIVWKHASVFSYAMTSGHSLKIVFRTNGTWRVWIPYACGNVGSIRQTWQTSNCSLPMSTRKAFLPCAFSCGLSGANSWCKSYRSRGNHICAPFVSWGSPCNRWWTYCYCCWASEEGKAMRNWKEHCWPWLPPRPRPSPPRPQSPNSAVGRLHCSEGWRVPWDECCQRPRFSAAPTSGGQRWRAAEAIEPDLAVGAASGCNPRRPFWCWDPRHDPDPDWDGCCWARWWRPFWARTSPPALAAQWCLSCFTCLNGGTPWSGLKHGWL